MYRTVSQAFSELITRQSLTSLQQQTATTRIQAIRNFLNNEFDLAEQPFVTGSYARGTICSGERDIDIMSPFKAFSQSNYWNRYRSNSRNFLYWVRDALNDRYATTTVSSKQISVTLDFNIIKVDIVPCFLRTGGGYLIPDGSGGWASTNPKYHTLLVNGRNTTLSNRLKPIIKLAKKWNIANGQHLRSFHLEMMVEAMWHDTSSIPNWSNAMKQTIATLPSWLRNSFYDPWYSTKRIDNYLSSQTRQQVIRMLNDDATAATNAEYYLSNNQIESAFERWDVVFRHTFPSRVY